MAMEEIREAHRELPLNTLICHRHRDPYVISLKHTFVQQLNAKSSSEKHNDKHWQLCTETQQFRPKIRNESANAAQDNLKFSSGSPSDKDRIVPGCAPRRCRHAFKTQHVCWYTLDDSTHGAWMTALRHSSGWPRPHVRF